MNDGETLHERAARFAEGWYERPATWRDADALARLLGELLTEVDASARTNERERVATMFTRLSE